jgi:hypothetical protein
MPTTPYGERVRNVLQTAVKTSGVKQATIERALGMSKGYLSQIFSGRIELKVWHLEVILEQIGFEPQVFFRMVYPFPGQESGTMEQFAAYASRRPLPHAAAAPAALPVELRSAIEGMVREALVAQLGKPEGERSAARRRPAAGARRKRPASR